MSQGLAHDGRQSREQAPESPGRHAAQPSGTAGQMMALQRAAGNRAVGALLRQAAPALRVQRWAEDSSATAMVAEIDSESVDDLRALVAAFDHPAGSGDHVGIAAGTHSLSIATADASALRTRAVQKLAQRLMTELASERAPVVARMQTLSGAAQRQAMNDLHTAETPRLAELRTLTGGEPNRWQHPDKTVQDAVLAAIQLEAVFRAESHLGDVTQAHHDAAQACGMSITDDWCGFFVATAFMQSDLDSDLRGGFFHVENVVDYFRYDYGRVNLSRIKKWIWADGSWRDIRAYHEERGSLRQWVDAAGIQAAGGAGLDIRPGDVALIDNRGSERPDHIVMVDSYDDATRTLITIGGNDSGYTIDTNPAHPAPAHETAADRGKRETLEAGTGQNLTPGDAGGVGYGLQDLGSQPEPGPIEQTHGKSGRPHARVFGVGRPSVVDFENHFYDATSLKNPPVAAPAHH